ncbi:putative tyrosine recombinase XerC-like protein [Candidatus Methanobinarius endosymbioticus]|uniref:Putative tyrosine recombinase XerC-like protein n=1 Tax=Candidatus Methanobinarius endosymbioticus TaxID=2006182 RepID=A0A366M887_9EURY|nr:putative tyrosine recombinase XerC-like protein [Candidatus Methanobinarius endosymbioticus]
MVYKRTRKNKIDENDYLFTSRSGNQLKGCDIQRIVKKYAIATDKGLGEKGYKADFKDRLTPHTLRHIFAIHLLNNAEILINEIQTLLGHSNISTTNIYTKIDNKTMQKSYEKINWNN